MPKGEDRVIVGQHAGLKFRHVRPLVGANQRRFRHDERVVVGGLKADIKRLFVIRLAGAVNLFPFGNVALMAFRLSDVVRHLALHRQGENLFGRRADPGNQFRRDAVAGNVEKANFAGRLADGVGHRLASDEIVAGQVADIDGR